MACAVGNQTRHDPETSSRSDDNDDDDDESGDDTQSEDGDEEEDDDDESGSDEEEEEGKEGAIRGLTENESAVRDLEVRCCAPQPIFHLLSSVSQSAHTRNAFNKILGNFPLAKGRPSFKKLRPVCASKTNLEEYLASVTHHNMIPVSIFSDLLYIPGSKNILVRSCMLLIQTGFQLLQVLKELFVSSRPSCLVFK